MKGTCGHCYSRNKRELYYAEINGCPVAACVGCIQEEERRRQEEEADRLYAFHVLDFERHLEHCEQEAYEEQERIEADRQVRDWERGAHGWDDAP